jgi:hypothetical protein
MSRLSPFTISVIVTIILLSGSFVPGQVPKAETRPAIVVEKAKVADIQKRQVPFPATRIVIMPGGVNAAPQHIAHQLRPILRAEYHFLRSVCNLTEAQRKQIAPKIEDMLEKVAAELAELQRTTPARPLGSSREPDPTDKIRARLGEIVRPLLSPSQMTQYEDETKNRNEHRKHAAIENLVVRLDRELRLSPEQQTRIIALLSDSWTAERFPWVEHYLYQNHQTPPPLADMLIRPILTPNQRDVWDSLPRNQFFIPAGYIVNNPIDNTLLRDGDLPEPAAVPLPAPAPPPPPPPPVPVAPPVRIRIR